LQSTFVASGGTNFGFTAGANDGGPGRYNSDVTSYDYDAPMDEAGDPTEKYFAIRKTISKFFPLPKVPVPDRTPKVKLPNVVLKPVSTLLDSLGRKHLATYTKSSEKPMTFEALDQNSGFVLYETTLPKTTRDPSLLKLSDLRDRAYIYVNRQFVGILSRENKIFSIPISLAMGNELQIVVENEGRINYGIANDFKGILGNVYYDTMVLSNWSMTGFPFENYEQIEEVVAIKKQQQRSTTVRSAVQSGAAYLRNEGHRPSLIKNFIRAGPTLLHGEFTLPTKLIADTYLDPTGWGKGLIFINGFNLGRYWPIVGPQITIYVPKEILKVGENKIAMLELQKAPESGVVTFSDTPNLDGNFE
jgi:beta-galactosidase